MREQEMMQNVSGKERRDKWGSRSTRRAQSSIGHLPFPLLPFPTELPNTFFERMGDKWKFKPWAHSPFPSDRRD